MDSTGKAIEALHNIGKAIEGLHNHCKNVPADECICIDGKCQCYISIAIRELEEVKRRITWHDGTENPTESSYYIVREPYFVISIRYWDGREWVGAPTVRRWCEIPKDHEEVKQ